MKKIILYLIFSLSTITLIAQTEPKQSGKVSGQIINPVSYQLFPTQNIWTFIKLDTRNGKMWQVHFTVKDDAVQGELILNPLSLVRKDEEIDCRFTLYPTENMYNFLLLDQIKGFVYQVQWSMDEEYRFVIPLF